jgi:hypothetical protein
MTVIKILLNFFIFSALLCCNNKSFQRKEQNDTTMLFHIALKTAFYHGILPGIESLRKTDSIVITGDSSYLKLIPNTVDTFNFKIVDQKNVCSFLNDSTKNNYLFIQGLEKLDSTYYLNIQNLSCKKFAGGGSIGLYLLKVGDSFIVKNHTSSSIN